MKVVRYPGSNDSVMLGDIVTTRVFLFRRKARVVYVPGISKKRSSLEHHGLQWVGLQELTGPFLAALVDPETFEIDKKVKFVSRGPEIALSDAEEPFVEPGEVIDDDGVESPSGRAKR